TGPSRDRRRGTWRAGGAAAPTGRPARRRAAPDRRRDRGRTRRLGSSAAPSGLGQVAGQAQSGELPARVRREEVAVAGAHVAARRGAAATAQHELAAHELGVVFAGVVLPGTEARIG